MKYKYDISFGIPAIRPELWQRLYDTALDSAGDKTFELIFISPYDLPDSMKNLSNVKLVKDRGGPPRCFQRSSICAEGELLGLGCDDAIFVKDGIKSAVDTYRENCRDQDGVIMKYTEGKGIPSHTPIHASDEYWQAGFHEDKFYADGIQNNWKWGHFLVKNSYFQEIGGVDCNYYVLSHGMHDLTYRMQNVGGKFYFTPIFVQNADWDISSKHACTQSAADADWHMLVEDFEYATDRCKIDFDNWKDSPEQWERFDGLLKSPDPTKETPKSFLERKREEFTKSNRPLWNVKKRYKYCR